MTPHEPSGAQPARHRRPDRGGTRGRPRVGLAAVALLLALGVGVGLGMLLPVGRGGASAGAPPQVSPAAGPSAAAVSADDLPARPTMLAQVVGVASGEVVTVDVAGRVLPVRVLGVDAPDPEAPGRPGECGAAEATAFATSTLQGQMVTLVPDPRLPETDEQGRRLSYVVLRSQLSYTDAALMAGTVRVDASRPLWYADVFAGEQARAVAAGEGIWGAPCRARPGA